jgi:uncharacterized protein YjbJ (UPF0337 family)
MRCVANKAIAINGGFAYGGTPCRNSKPATMRRTERPSEGNWKQTKGKIKEKWGQLTDDDLTQINGKRDQLEGKIQERYGLAKDRARKDIDEWLSTVQ